MRKTILPSFASCALLAAHVVVAQVPLADDLQRTVSLPQPARRIVSLAPSITETLFAIGAADHIVGVTNYCNYPIAATAKQKVGGITNPSIETIISLEPDLILVSMEGNMRNDFDKLTSFGVPVFVTNPRSLEGIYKSMTQIGELTGKKENAATLVKAMQTRADSIASKAKRLRRKSILFFVSLQPIIVVGKSTFLTQLIELAGGTNTAVNAASTYPTYSREAVLKDDPDLLIFMAEVAASPAALVTLYPEWAKLKAFKRKTVFRIDADIVSRPGPRAVDGLALLYKLIHEKHK